MVGLPFSPPTLGRFILAALREIELSSDVGPELLAATAFTGSFFHTSPSQMNFCD